MTIIDLGTFRATRAAELQAAKELTDTAVATVKAAAEGYAEMAFGLSRMVRLHSEQLAVDVNRSQWRRALSTVKAATRQATPEIREAFRGIASQAFTHRLDQLIREDDKRRSVTDALEVVGGMWVTAGRTRWKPNPWPCTVTLGRAGTLAWMDHIELTPYVMKPETRQRFDEARIALQDPDRWPGDKAEKTVNRIIRSCWERGWRLEERAA
ncbi:MAG: hypothetical protein ACRYGP_30235 [Janthinobacterium lividum]